ncbi:endonuclease [Mycoplasmopsis gallinacea]|uniref:Extracellular ribonuclease n=1 Tax=Mycoplasmopsis gallinacea TaxID=29556 RepID=A0A449A4C6_9BACT|nr:endonuclease [Mycoplasmopsis gallinacea]VEU59023.1 Extracellular ribonuclease precursor [Mycoplasmopsis gallinacea]
MKKFKLLLTMAPTSMVFAPFILTSCNEPKTQKENTPKNTTGETTTPSNPGSSNSSGSNETPAPTNPSTGDNNATGGTTNPENPTPENPNNPENGSGTGTSTDTPTPTTPGSGTTTTNENEALASTISNEKVAAFVREHGANNIFKVSEQTDWTKMIEHLNSPDPKFGLQFWYFPEEKTFGARKPKEKALKDGIVFESVSNLFTNVSPAVTDSKYHTTKAGYPNTNLKAEYNPSTGVVTIKYYLVEIGPDGKAVSQTEKFGPYTSTFTVKNGRNSLDSSSNNNNNSSNTSSNTNTGTNDNVVVSQPNVTVANLIYQPSDYYNSLEGKSGAELMKALVALQSSKHETGSYDGLKNLYKNTNAFKDLYYENDGTLLDVYSENPNGNDPYVYPNYVGGSGASTEGNGTNREHIIPQGWFNKVDKMRNDPFHVWPTDIKVNNWRDNDPHDNVTNVTLTTKNGSKQGSNSEVSFRVFEPINEFKGDIARAYLYFAFTYANEYKYSLNGPQVFQSEAPYLKTHFLNTYLSWNAQDPISKWDIDRNNIISDFTDTKRRNPFVDYPNLVENLFGENPKPFHNLGILVGIQENSN